MQNNNKQKRQAMDYADISLCASLRPNQLLNSAKAIRQNPIDVFKRLALAEHFDFEKINENELHLSIGGFWCEHDISIVWQPKREQIDLYLLLEGYAPTARRDEMYRLISLINERLQAGHFEFWRGKNALIYRNQMNLAGGAALKIEQAMALLSAALNAAERGYPASQYVIWAGKTPEEALDKALLDIANNG